MANRQQLRRLKREGVEAWNQWRRENPEVAIDVRGANLKRLVLRGFDLSRADIRGANFSQADLTGANFTGAQAGLQKRWSISLFLLAMVGALISGVLSAFNGFLTSLIFDSSLENIMGGWVGLLGLTALYILLLRKSFAAFAVTGAIAIAVAITGAGAGAAAIAIGSEIWKGSTAEAVAITGAAIAGTVIVVVAIAGAVAGVVIGAVAITVARATLGVAALAITVMGTVAVAVTIGGAIAAEAVSGVEVIAGPIVVAGVVAGAVVCISVCVGVQALAGDEKYTAIRSLAIALAAMGGTQFRRANLSNTDFFEAQLKGIDLRSANVTRTHFHQAKNLDRARCGGTILDVPAVRDLAVTHNGRDKDYTGQNLKGINLRGADLSDANLTEADLSDATLENAILERANLTKIQALRTQFRQANLTAACLEAWNIDSTTALQEVICDHVYLLKGHQHRLPRSGSFAPGEFGKLFEKALDTVDLIFADGIDWQAFFHSFQDLRQQYGNDLSIQAIEKKSGGTFVVRLEVPEAFDKAALEQAAKAEYETQLQIVEARYQAKLEAKDEVIDGYKRQSADLTAITKVLAEAPRTQFNQYNYGGTNFQNDISGGQVNQGETVNTKHTENEP